MKRYLKTLKRYIAIEHILEHTRPIEDEENLPVYLCKGRITSKPVFAKISNPHFICAAMDGYAVSFTKTLGADVTNPIPLLKNKDVFPVNTGDPLHGATDAVIMIEDIEESDLQIVIRKPLYLWQNTRMIGEDIIEGDMLLPVNHVIGALDIGLLISSGVSHIPVRKKPRVMIIPSGKELIDIYKETPAALGKHKLIDFNSYTLFSLAKETGFDADISKIAITRKELEEIVSEATGSYDMIMINAGSSAGREDYTEGVIKDLGKLVFHGVSMMPGKPVMFGVINQKPVFGIPGYPVSAVLCFETFIKPLYEKMTNSTCYRKHITCITPYKIHSRIGIEEVIRVNLIAAQEKYYAIVLPRGASIFSSIAYADGLIRIPEQVEGYNENEQVTCELLIEEERLKKRIHIVGSHDLSINVLRNIIKNRHPGIDIISTHTGSLSGIIAFGKGVTQLCTTHILDENEKIYNIPILRKYVPDKPCLLVHIARRIQGILVQKNNPKNIKDIRDLARKDVTFINRQAGSGTRILLDNILKEKGIEKSSINGYDREESSHTAVGILVKESIADAGLAIYSAARLFSLDFIPIAEEDYDLLVTKEFAEDERFAILMDIISSNEFKEALKEMGGYSTRETGKIKYVNG